MSGPVYSFVRLFLATLYPAYYSFKAVKNKNVKEWVFWELLIIELSNNMPIAGMSSGWCTGSSTHSLLHLNQSWIHSSLSGKKTQRHNEGREGGKCLFQASFLQRGQDGLAALLGGTGYKRVRSYIQKVTILLLIIRIWSLICNLCSITLTTQGGSTRSSATKKRRLTRFSREWRSRWIYNK